MLIHTYVGGVNCESHSTCLTPQLGLASLFADVQYGVEKLRARRSRWLWFGAKVICPVIQLIYLTQPHFDSKPKVF